MAATLRDGKGGTVRMAATLHVSAAARAESCTTELFNDTIMNLVPAMDKCKACRGS